MTATARRAMRIPEPVWLKALEVTKANDTTVTAVVVAALEDYTTVPVVSNTTPKDS